MPSFPKEELAENAGGYRYEWSTGAILNDETIANMAKLYSIHYGIWSLDNRCRSGKPVTLSVKLIRKYTSHEKITVASAFLGEELVGYAIREVLNSF